MAQTNPHNRIIAAAAKAALAPLGFQRKGVSRTWLADHGYWLDAIEFQPSGFSKGTYCNVAVHWLWGMTPALTFDYGLQRMGSFARFDDEGAFDQSVALMTRAAVRSVERHRSIFVTISATATHLAKGGLSKADPNGWEAFHAGIACGLIQDDRRARRMFDRVAASDNRNIDWVNERRSKAERLMVALGDRIAFRSEVQTLIDRQRSQFKLGTFTLPE